MSARKNTRHKITHVAIKRKTGKVDSLPVGKKHKDIGGKGERGFKDSKGNFVDRQTAKRITGKPKRGRRGTHSGDLKK